MDTIAKKQPDGKRKENSPAVKNKKKIKWEKGKLPWGNKETTKREKERTFVCDHKG